MRLCLIAALIITGVAPMLIFECSFFSNYEQRSVNKRISDLQNRCNILSKQLANGNYMTDQSSESLNSAVVQLANYYNGRIVIVDGSLKIIKDTYGLKEKKILISETVIKSFKGENHTVYDDRNQYIEIAFPITDTTDTKSGGGAGKTLGVMVASVSTEDLRGEAALLREKSNVLLSVIAVLIVVVAWILSNWLVKPLKKIVVSLERVADGYMDASIEIGGFTEIGQVSTAFQKMLTRLKSLDESRQEFVSNVSHELKTPITSMKVLADSLLSQEEVPNELYREFMVDIADEIDRESTIINDLLSLVKLDKGAQELKVTPVDINELLELILKRLRPIAAKRNIELVLESFRPVTAEIDEVKLTLALSNLVENAIKYNRDDGWVKVSLNADHKYFYVKVADSGIGISEEEQDKIFERFYRVDKARSRETGGTGLGLAITKNIILMHHGAIKVISKEEEGTTFTVRIPLTFIA